MAQIQKQAHSSLQQNREPRNKPMYGQLVYDKEVKNI